MNLTGKLLTAREKGKTHHFVLLRRIERARRSQVFLLLNLEEKKTHN